MVPRGTSTKPVNVFPAVGFRQITTLFVSHFLKTSQNIVHMTILCIISNVVCGYSEVQTLFNKTLIQTAETLMLNYVKKR